MKNETVQPTPNFSVSSTNKKPDRSKAKSDREDIHVFVDISRINDEMSKFKKPRIKSLTGVCKDGDVPELWRVELEEAN